MAAVDPASDGPLAGLVVIDLSTTLPGAQATQFLADCGAEVIMVEPPDGSPLRELASWPALLRGKRSVTWTCTPTPIWSACMLCCAAPTSWSTLCGRPRPSASV